MVEANQSSFEPKGEIQRFTLSGLLVQILDRDLSGRLYIQSGESQVWIQIMQGCPSGAQIKNAEVNLGMILRELGLIDDQSFNNYLMNMAKKGQSNVQVLLEMGLDREHLARGLVTQLSRRLNELFGLREGEYWFTEEEPDSPGLVQVKLHPFLVIYNGIKNYYKEEELEAFVKDRLADKSIRVSDRFQSVKKELELPEEELADIGLLEEHRLFEEYLQASKSGATTAVLLLMILDHCNLLETGEKGLAKAIAQEEKRSSEKHKPEQADGGKASSSRAGGITLEFRRRLKQKIEHIKADDHFGVLEVSHNANEEEVRRSYVQLTKIFHPDLVAAYNDQDLHSVCSFVFGKINDAYAILINPKTRGSHLRSAQMKGDGKIDPDPETALLEYEKARVYINKKNYVEAAKHLHIASRLDPDKSDYRAHYIWFEFVSVSPPNREKLIQVRQSLLKMFHEVPGSFYVNRYLCLVFKQLGDDEDYEKHLRKANWIKPNEIETARELRLVNSRKGKEKKGSRLPFLKKPKR